MWKGKISDVAPDFTYYVIKNQPWNAELHGATFSFRVLGYSQEGLPSLKVNFQGQVHGERLSQKAAVNLDSETSK